MALGLAAGNIQQTQANSGRKTNTGAHPILILESDSYPEPLFFANDYVCIGLRAIPELHYIDNSVNAAAYRYLMFSPLYFSYYFQIKENLFLGAGMSLGIAQTNYKATTTHLNQRDGYHLLIRQHINNHENFIDYSWFSARALALWDGETNLYQYEALSISYGMVFH